MMSLDPADTIAAIASPVGPGLRGIVRLSGPQALEIARGRFEPDRPPFDSSIRRAERITGRLGVEGFSRTLAVAVSFWPGTRTYTGQPLAEIHAVGSPPILSQILADCLTRGARLAEPGEFTLRAFLSGRIDLTQSEAVLDVIDAGTPARLDAALRQLAGGLASPIARLRDRLADILAHLEANLDFADEPDVDPLGSALLARSLEEAAAQVLGLVGQLRGRDRSAGRPRVVLVGPPNAGKSQLFNALVGLERAIVSPVAGTTRDYLEAPCECDGLAIDLVDTAGFETATNRIDTQAQSARGDQARIADLVLECQPANGLPLEAGPPMNGEGPRLRVSTKADLAPSGSGEIRTSALTGEGLIELRRLVAATLRQSMREADLASGTAARSGEGLTRASQALEAAAETLRAGGGDELVAIDLSQALDDLGRVVGAVVTDDLLDRIFRRFCIGK